MSISSVRASIRAKALVLALRDVLKNEEAWEIAEEHLSQAYQEGTSYEA